MFESPHPPPTLIFIFGGSGDLSYRKLVPALFNLFLDGRLPEHFTVYGLGRTPYTDEQYHEHVLKGIELFSRRKKEHNGTWEAFSKLVKYLSIDVSDASQYSIITQSIDQKHAEFGTKPAVIFYLAVAPQLVPTILKNMQVLPACLDRENTRIVVEKPFGSDLESAHELNRQLSLQFKEDQ
ncbi:MAG: glucose-6-phosphate dehydrogenase, partial [Chitinophagaceae bacterium]|nr:glucose-6-phosphate dehydrogenase [Chitinophagaceae bacterium]